MLRFLRDPRTRIVGLLLLWPVAGAPPAASDGPAQRDPLRDARPPTAPRFAPPAEGVLFADDFSADTLSGWTADRPGVWSVQNGMLRADLPDGRQQRSLLRAGSTRWTDYAVDLDVCMMRGVDKGVIVRLDGHEGVGVDLRGPGYHDLLLQHGFRTLGRANVVNGNGIWHHLRVEARGHRYRVFVNGRLEIDHVDPRASSPDGGIALPAYTGGAGKCTVYYANVVVTALGPEPAGAREAR
jgi:hypothetical protein